ncbi:serine hydrolase [Lachnospiraceae bacterium 62-35]
MERGLQVMGRKWTKTALIGILLAAAFLLISCGQETFEQPYEFEARRLQTEETESSRLPAFADSLCVVWDEDSFEDEEITSEAAALFSLEDKEVMFSHNAFEPLYPASITKVMTALLALKYGTLSDMVTVTDDVIITEEGATLCHINPGDSLTLEQLLYGLMLPSGNDAGVAIAVHMAGSVEAFSDMMNEEARRIGATGTHFVNPHGLNNEQHYTTAYDLYLIFNEALNLPEPSGKKFRDIISSTSYYAEYENKNGETVSQTWKGGNWYMTGEREEPKGLTVFGGKTGTTKSAGYCLIMASRDDEEKEYISIILKAESRPGLYDNMTNLIQKIVD